MEPDTTPQESPYQRVLRQAREADERWKQETKEANHQEFALIQVSSRKYRVIHRYSYSRHNDKWMIIGWEYATDNLDYDKALAFLIEKLGGGKHA